ncbi:DUF2202 domain-containing protein [Lutibacter sp.]|uniref:DUF2202 domain-containing protein n=1 Tax=Lutibacter sp. TaxID=1925666 RepID=UPI0025C27F86|nr:DUF2202 domain-containing protein [Lutibacter sp.]MCF6167006.1 DUF2202 domain-containing protein [Lutibacter sp.]
MKKLTLVVLVLTALSSCSNDENDVVTQSTTQLTQQEIDDLLFLREEEKLARDVYLFSYDKYAETIFNSISQSEQQHMNSVLTLLNTYGIADPASSERGVFKNQTLQSLYNDLTTQSDISLLEALKVGAIIEDLDLNDIHEDESNTTKEDIINVYEKLSCGSRNHLRSYTSQLLSNGENYIPQFISLAEFEEVINSESERCGY